MDVLSYRQLGEVFTSAMTGNMALLGMRVGQGNLAGISRNLAALIAFLLGAWGGSVLLRRHERGLSREVMRTLGAELILLIAFAVAWAWVRHPALSPTGLVLIVLSAAAMGVQTVAARAVGLSAIATTFFTGTLTSLIFRAAGPESTQAPQETSRPLGAFVAYVLGAATAGFLDSRARTLPSLALAALPSAAVALVLLAGSRQRTVTSP